MNKLINKYIDIIDNNDINNNDLKKIELDSMGDNDIRYYYPNAKIMNISDLEQYNDINQILPNEKDYCFLLYEHKPFVGHWTIITKNNNNISYFDSYGGKIDNPINWINKEQQEKLNVKPYLSDMLINSNYNIDYNGIDFQNKKNNNIATCGRHCCTYLKTFLNYNFDLDDYIDFMKTLKSKTDLNYDYIVSEIINKI